MVKRYANDICNTRHFEISVMSEATSHHLHELTITTNLLPGCRLVNGHQAPKKMVAFLASTLDVEDLAPTEFRTSVEMHLEPAGSCHTKRCGPYAR